jgi:two-component system CheB/CheR fusion protein
MPKPIRARKTGSTTKETRRSKPAVKGKGKSLSSEIHEMADKMRLVKQKSGKLARESSEVRRAADTVHEGVERVHRTAEAAHTEIRSMSRSAEGKKEPVPKKAFLVVGIGASAGGFEAFIELLEHLPADTGMAFVFVQHLDPTHESKLAPLLSHSTQMHVAEIRDRTRVTPNHIYVIPPNTALTLSHGILHLSPRKSGDMHMPIDHFFQSLAEDQGNLAVGVVLSGNGHDGTIGLKQIKAAGGITFSQELSSAKYPGMPESAESSGCVDFVLQPPGISQELERIGSHEVLKRVKAAKADPTIPGTESDLTKLFALVRANTGVDFSCYKLTTLKRRIMRRMVLRKIEKLEDYLRYLQQNAPEIELLFQDILINVTGFFRDPAAFQVLKKKIFPRVVKHKGENSPIRVWVPGCATGEEVYSLAISLHEFLGKNQNNKSIQIFGTDISEVMVGRARAGMYPRSIESEVSPERLRRYFQKVDSGYQISKFIRDACIFAKQNVAEDPPFSKLDLISCRNLLIYLGLSLQKKVLPTFHYSLRPGGYLMLGTSETIGTFSNLFTLVDKRNKIYIRNETYSRPEIEFMPAANLEIAPRGVVAEGRRHGDVIHFDLQKKAEEILLNQFCSPAVIVNGRMDVLHFLGKTGPYLEPQTGSASLNLLKMVRDELTVDLRTAITQCARTHSPVRKEGIRIKFNGHYQDVTIEVVPFKNSLPERFFLILFRDVTMPPLEEGKGGRKRSVTSARQQQAEREAVRLRQELNQTKESLQTIIEEQEATNEELKSANEEIQSSNEELQSTNEELETAKEELQSTNEELTTLNEELQTRNADLSQANNDLNNLISSFNMPIVMLGNDLTIRRFTPLAQKIFNLIPSDIGRRISDINPNVALPDLNEIVTEVIDSLNVKEIEVQDREGHWYSLRIRPYRTAENKIDGAVIVLVDIGDVRQGLEDILEMVGEPMLLLTSDLKVSKANEAFCQKFAARKEQTEGKSFFKLGDGQWDVQALRGVLDSMMPGSNPVTDFRVTRDFPGIGKRELSLSARRLYQNSKGTYYVLMLCQDVTK